MEYEYFFQSDEHQFPIILWVRIDGLNELDDCFTHLNKLKHIRRHRQREHDAKMASEAAYPATCGPANRPHRWR